MEDVAPGIVSINFAIGAVGLEWDDRCRVVGIAMEASALGVLPGWVICMVGGKMASDGRLMQMYINLARRSAGWSENSAATFWQRIAEPRLEAAAGGYRGDEQEEHIARAMQSVRRMAAHIGKTFAILFCTNLRQSGSGKVEQIASAAVESRARIFVTTLGGHTHCIELQLDETVRALKAHVARAVGIHAGQVALMLPNGTMIAKSGCCRSDDARAVASLGLVNGASVTLVAVQRPPGLAYLGEHVTDRCMFDSVMSLKTRVEQISGTMFDDFEPVGYHYGPEPLLDAHDLRLLSVLDPLPTPLDIVVRCVQKLRPLGDEDDIGRRVAKAMLRDNRLIHALTEYDGAHLREVGGDDCVRLAVHEVRDLLSDTAMHGLLSGFGLARLSSGAHGLLRWVLATLPELACEVDLPWASEMHKAEVFVKVRTGLSSFIHICIHTCAYNRPEVLGVRLDRGANDPIEWFPPCDKMSILKGKDKAIGTSSRFSIRKSTAWR